MFATSRLARSVNPLSRCAFTAVKFSNRSFVSSMKSRPPLIRSRGFADKPSAAAAAGAVVEKESFAKANPFAFQVMVATVKTSAADLLCQVVAEKKKFSEVDWKRNGLFVVFGAGYLGCFQWFIMVTKYRVWFPTMDAFSKLTFAEKLKHKAGMIDAGKMVLFDIFVHMPMMYFPAYYTCKEFIFSQSWNPVDWVKDGVTKYAGNFTEDWVAMAKLWGPSDCIQFVLPLHIRMPFRHCVSFFWTAYVSFTRGENKEES
ncbi:hypothetical protein TrST_g6978 [Triparma strigata]|uniref:Uncharacterized protein n=1 Tax=Triparma strigata TaxID=1606541 RepID=A0A9W7AVQ0_9STRA|nr:hypothetical protein TrST_g6978 [Triparma strigata]